MAFRRLRPGDMLDGNISAKAYNKMLEIVERLELRKLDSGFSDRFGTPTSVIQAKNNGAGLLAQTNVVKILSPLILPSTSLEKFRSIPIIQVGPPTGRGSFAVVAGALKANEIGTVITSGVTPVQIDVVHETHTHADLIDGDKTKLRSGFTGHARILWKEAGTGVKHALIQFPVADQGTVFGKPDADIDPDDSGDVTVWVNGSATTAVLEGHLTWMHGGQKVSAGKEVELTWSPLEAKWVITGAECED